MNLALRRALLTGGVAVALLGLGAGLAAGLSDALGLASAPTADIPVEQLAVAPVAAINLPPRFTMIDAADDLRTRTAVAELNDAVASASGTDGTATLTVTAGTGEAEDDTYSLTGTRAAMTITAPSITGAVRGIYDLADAARAGRAIDENLGETITSRLSFRMVDPGAVGVPIDEDAYRAGTDYSHNSGAFSDVILDEAPWVDDDALAIAQTEFEEYVRHSIANGYNAITVSGFIEYLDFSLVGDGHEVYAEGDSHPARAAAMRESFGPMWQYAHEMGMKVYFRTDMLALSTPLEEYFERTFGGLDTENPEFWDVYRAGLDELYAAMPFVDGVLIRIGEAGRVYDLEGWDYYSELAVTSVESVRAMLTAFTAQAEQAGKEVIFRTWSVGVGAVGDMHTDPASYHEVLDGIDSPNLIVSTKYSAGDFYSYLPLNTTLETGDQRRIIEFQSRREFEDYGALPNDLGDLYQTAIHDFLAANPHIEGIWTWTQDGGPWRAGPMSLTLKAGFWQLYELNTELAVDLARDPEADTAAITADWARRYFSDDPATVSVIGQVMAQSREAVTGGLYIGPFATQTVAALGLNPPPMMWIFEWDILTGDSAVLDVIYQVSKPELEQAIAEGDAAIETAKAMQELLATTDPVSWRDEDLREHFANTLDYQVNLYETLGSYRTMVLRHVQWLDTGSAEAYSAWEHAKDRYQTAAAEHVARYEGDLDLPAYNLTAAQLGVDRAERDLPMAWLARIVLVLLLGWLLLGALAGRARIGALPGARAARATWVAGTRPWRAAEVVAGLSRRDRWLVALVPLGFLLLSRGIYTWFLAPAHLIVTSAAWLLFAGVLALALRGRNAWPVIAAVGGAVLLRVLLLIAVLAVRGPGGYWYGFWTDPTRRSLYVTVAFALFIWVIVAAGWALGGQIGGRRATGAALASTGAVLAVLGTLIGLAGLETALTIWNDQMALLPWGLSRILGLTVYLEIPADTPWFAAVFGLVLLVVGVLLALPGRKRSRSGSPGLPADG